MDLPLPKELDVEAVREWSATAWLRFTSVFAAGVYLTLALLAVRWSPSATALAPLVAIALLAYAQYRHTAYIRRTARYRLEVGRAEAAAARAQAANVAATEAHLAAAARDCAERQRINQATHEAEEAARAASLRARERLWRENPMAAAEEGRRERHAAELAHITELEEAKRHHELCMAREKAEAERQAAESQARRDRELAQAVVAAAAVANPPAPSPSTGTSFWPDQAPKSAMASTTRSSPRTRTAVGFATTTKR